MGSIDKVSDAVPGTLCDISTISSHYFSISSTINKTFCEKAIIWKFHITFFITLTSTNSIT